MLELQSECVWTDKSKPGKGCGPEAEMHQGSKEPEPVAATFGTGTDVSPLLCARSGKRLDELEQSQGVPADQLVMRLDVLHVPHRAVW